MLKTLKNQDYSCKKQKPKIKQEANNTQSTLPPILQAFKQNLLSGNGFVEI